MLRKHKIFRKQQKNSKIKLGAGKVKGSLCAAYLCGTLFTGAFARGFRKSLPDAKLRRRFFVLCVRCAVCFVLLWKRLRPAVFHKSV